MTPTTATRFNQRGLIGFVLIVSSLILAFVFRRSSSWPGLNTQGVMPCAYSIGMVGTAFASSHIWQKNFAQMKGELMGVATLLMCLLLSCFH